jgi:butyrate kinase
MAVLAVYLHGRTLHVGVGGMEVSAATSFPLPSSDFEPAVSEQVLPWLEAAGVARENLEFIVTSGVLKEDLPSGIYRLDADSALEPEWGGRELCTVLASHLSTPIYLIDPASRGECHPHARVTGTPAIQRTCSADHFLFKYLARQEAAKRDLRHSEGRFIVAHLDEVHQLGAVVGTKVVDCLSSADEGPFALYHSGGLPFDGVLELCSSHPQRQEVLKTLSVEGGLRGYLGLERLADLLTAQGEQAALVRDALVYQVAKEIGALAAVLAGQVDAIICGGELAKVEPFMVELRRRVAFMAPISAVPGNQGLAALLAGAGRILAKEPIVNLS